MLAGKNDCKPSLAEELRKLQEVNPDFSGRLFDLKEVEARHNMDIEKQKETNKMRIALFRFWNLIFFRILLGGLAATLFYMGYEIAAIWMLGGFLSTLLPLDLKKFIPFKKQIPPGE